MKCILGLSFLLFLVPQSCKPDEALSLGKEISKVLGSIFEGARSIWLFDFVTSGPYMKYILKTLDGVIGDECDDYDWATHLITHVVSHVIITADSLKAVEQYISGFVSKNKASKTILITLHAFLKKISQVLPHSHNGENYKTVLARITFVTCSSFVKYMKSNFNESVGNIVLHSLFIKCYTLVIEIICCPEFKEDANLKKESLELLSSILAIAMDKNMSWNVDGIIDAYLLFISKTSKHSLQISPFLPNDFEAISWSIMLSHLEIRAEMNKNAYTAEKNSDSGLQFVDSKSCCICLGKSVQSPLSLETVECSKDVPKANALLLPSLNESEKESLGELSIITSSEKLLDVFLLILNKMGCSSSSEIEVSTFHTFISVFQCLIDNNSEKCHQPLLNKAIQKGMTYLYCVINRTCESQVCQTMISIPILDLMSLILKGNKGLPRQLLFQTLHCVASISIEVYNNDYDLYVKSFTAAWNVVYNLFVHQTTMILASPAPFLAYVTKLLKSIVKAGSVEPLTKCDTNTIQQIQLCAQNMNRLLTVISRCKTEFAKLVPYLVADYVDTVQHYSLETNIKESILSGVYRLLNICSDDSIKMLSININYISREIYNNLVKNYKQNKYSGAM